MRSLITALAVGLAAILHACPAAADWQYTKWGMTPEEVVKASGGLVREVPNPAKAGSELLAVWGRHTAGDLEFTVSFGFLDGKLNSVLLVFQKREMQNCEDVASALEVKYGPPDINEADGLSKRMIWPKREGEAGIMFRQEETGKCWVNYRNLLPPVPDARARAKGL
jgi:hypothetical protein